MKKQFIIFLALVVSLGFVSVPHARAEDLSSRLSGRILLQVEAHGEAWYVYPKDGLRYYMANGSEAYNIMRNLGVGITNVDLAKIKANSTFAKLHQGKIFLQVEAHGEAYYIHIDGTAYYLKDGEAAYSIMRNLGLGITNSDLIKITSSSEDNATSSIPVADTFNVKISSSTCTLITQTADWGDVTYVHAVVNGTAQGPVGARVELPILIWSDDKWSCGDWTLTTGALIAVGSTCTRKEGQSETTTWTIDTGSEKQGEFLRGKTRFYTAKIYQKGELYSKVEAKSTYICQ